MTRALRPIGTSLCIAAAIVLATPAVHASVRPPAPTANAAGAAITGQAQPGQVQRPRATGDAWLDARLAEIDRYALRYPDAFAAELERYAGVPQAYVSGLLAQPGWEGGDVWFACFLADATGASCRSVVRAHARAGADAGWEDVALEFDARPGSDAYRDVRLSLADSYRRWARPLQPDAALARALRKRAEAEATP